MLRLTILCENQDNFYYKTFSNDNRCHETTKESQVQLKLIREHVTAVVKTYFNSR